MTDSDNGGEIGIKFRKKLKRELLSHEEIKNDIIKYNKMLYEKINDYNAVIAEFKDNEKYRKSLKNVLKQLVLINVSDDAYLDDSTQEETWRLFDNDFNIVELSDDMKENYFGSLLL